MTPYDRQERAFSAAKAYVERMGFSFAGEEDGMWAFSAFDGDNKVRVFVESADDMQEIPSIPSAFPGEISATRVDYITVLVIAEDRALLRHHRGWEAEANAD